jgi:hypothetical protein
MVYESSGCRSGRGSGSSSVHRGYVAQIAKLVLAVSCALSFPTPLAEARTAPEGSEKCLASAVYYESRGEPVKARRAVVDTILNRSVESGKPVCDVISEKRQFSWFRRKGWKPYDDDQRELLSETLSHPKILKDKNHRWFYSGPKPGWAGRMICKPLGRLNFCKEKNG